MKEAGNDPAALTRLVQESSAFQEVHALALRALKQAEEVDAAKGVLKACRERYNATMDDIQMVSLDQQPGLPFAAPKAETKRADAQAEKPPAKVDASDEAFTADLAKQTLTMLGIKGKLAETLDLEGIRDGQALSLWLNVPCPREIAGIANGGVNKAKAALEEWTLKWAKEHPAKEAPEESVGDKDAAIVEFKATIEKRAGKLVPEKNKLANFASDSANALEASKASDAAAIRLWTAKVERMTDDEVKAALEK